MVSTARPARNAAKRVAATSQPPWASWRGSRLGRYVRFVENVLVVPKGNGARRSMKLHPYQREWFEQWLDPGTRAAMVKVPRGNAKTTTLAAFCVAQAHLDEDADVPMVGPTLTQLRRGVFGVAARLIELSPELSDRTAVYTGVGTERLFVPANNSVIYPMSDRPDGLQGLDPTTAVLDEAAFASQETWDSLVLASGKRPDSLCVGIGTPSFAPENAMLTVERAWRSGQVLPGFTFREWVAPDGCDHRDEKTWTLANPGLGTKPPILAIDALRTTLAISPEQAFRCFRLAQWPTTAAGGWLGDDGYERWQGLEDPYDLVPGEPTWAGVDVARKHDTAAVVLAQFRPDGRLHVSCRIWYPSDARPIDPLDIVEHLRRAHRDYRLQATYFDPAYFDLAARILEDEGLTMVHVDQSPMRMTPIVGGCYEAIMRGLISHDGDPAFTTQVMNAQQHTTERGFTLRKFAYDHKIDAAVAMCMAHRAAVAAEPVLTDEMLLGGIL